MNERYIMIGWPEIQKYMDTNRWNECYICSSVSDSSDDTWAVPEDLYEEIEYKKSFPKVYKDTNLGTIICEEKSAKIIDTNEIFAYDLSNLKKGNKALIWFDDKTWGIFTVSACAKGFPIMFKEDTKAFNGLNCELIGHYEPK